jgi:hypothetical protein
MKRSTKFWLSLAFILFIFISILSHGKMPLAILVLAVIAYFIFCIIDTVGILGTDSIIPNKYNFIYQINKLIDGSQE